MTKKVITLAAAGTLLFAAVAVAKTLELEGDFGDAHPNSEVTAKVEVRDGVSTLVKTFEFKGLIAECEDGSSYSISGESGREAEVVKRNDRRRFEMKLTRGQSVADVHGRVSRSGKRLKGELKFESKSGCEADARFKLTR